MQNYLSNLILNTDSYKTSHYLQYPPKTAYVSCYIESRKGALQPLLFFGIQAFIKAYLLNPIKSKDIQQAKAFLTQHGLPFNNDGWEYILKKHKGFLPIEIQALPEGTIINSKNVLVQVINTDPKCYWLTTYIETMLLRAIWYPTTVATLSYHCKKVIKSYLSETEGNTENLNYKLHDFGARGVSSLESASIGGMAHLINFEGTDTISGILAAKTFYGEKMAGISIPAAEHNCIMAWGEKNEQDAYKTLLDMFLKPNQMVSIVSDTYDIKHAIKHIWCDKLKNIVSNSDGTLIIRTDSGNPVKMVIETLEILMQFFGHDTNQNGYRILPPYIRLIHGDSINLKNIQLILEAMKNANMSADNITFGMGGELLQNIHRDTLNFAMKASLVCIDNTWKSISKKPISEPEKHSKSGKFAVIKDKEDNLVTIQHSDLSKGQVNYLKRIFANGKLLLDAPFSEIRKRAADSLKDQT